MNTQLAEILRLLRNIIRIGTVAAVNPAEGVCRVDTGNNTTGWLPWLSARAGKTRAWSAPSQGEQVLVLCLGGELETGFVLPGIFSDVHPAPSASAEALHWSFADGAELAYEPQTGALHASGIRTASISAAEKILLDAPLVECTSLLKTAQLNVTAGGSLQGDVSHSGGQLSSNGVVMDIHDHGGVQRGGSRTDGPK